MGVSCFQGFFLEMHASWLFYSYRETLSVWTNWKEFSLSTIFKRWNLTLHLQIVQTSSKMQALVVPNQSTLSTIGSSTSEAFSTVLDKVSDCSNSSRAKLDPENGRMTEGSCSQRHQRKAVASRSINCGPSCERFCKAVFSRRCRKACEDAFLVFATIATMCVCSLPTVVYFSAMVRDETIF